MNFYYLEKKSKLSLMKNLGAVIFNGNPEQTKNVRYSVATHEYQDGVLRNYQARVSLKKRTITSINGVPDPFIDTLLKNLKKLKTLRGHESFSKAKKILHYDHSQYFKLFQISFKNLNLSTICLPKL